MTVMMVAVVMVMVVVMVLTSCRSHVDNDLELAAHDEAEPIDQHLHGLCGCEVKQLTRVAPKPSQIPGVRPRWLRLPVCATRATRLLLPDRVSHPSDSSRPRRWRPRVA